MSLQDRGRIGNRSRPGSGRGSRGGKANTRTSTNLTRSRSKSEQTEIKEATATGGSRFNCIQYLCMYCDEYCRSDEDTDWSQNVLQCKKCKGWLHKECLPLTDDEIMVLYRNMVDYVCETCSQKLDSESDEDAMYGMSEEQLTQGRTFNNTDKDAKCQKSVETKEQNKTSSETLTVPPNNAINQRLDAMMIILQETRSKIEKVDANTNKTTERLNAIDKKIAEQIPAVEKRVKDIVDMHIGNALENFEEDVINRRIDDALQEYNEREWRKKNVILVNVKESRKSSIPEKQEDDLVVVTRIFNRVADFKGLDDLEYYPVRIGKPGDRPRLLRVTFRHEFMARIMTQRAKQLNDAINPFEQDKKKRIYVNRDFTFREREMRRELKNELKRRQAQGEKNLTIRKNQIVEIQQNQPNKRSYADTAKFMLPNQLGTDDSYYRINQSPSYPGQFEHHDFEASSPNDKPTSPNGNEEISRSTGASKITEGNIQATPKNNSELQLKQQMLNQTEFLTNRIITRKHTMEAKQFQRGGNMSPVGRGMSPIGRGASPIGRGYRSPPSNTN